MTERIGVEFSGSSRGAITAAKQTAAAIDGVKHSAAGTGAPLRGMTQDLSRVERGAIAGSGAFHGLGRSIAFASSAFIGAAGFTAIVKASISNAETYEAALRSVKVAINATGGSAVAYGKNLAELVKSGANLGFTNTEVLAGFKTITLTTGQAAAGVRYMGLVEDIARAKGLSLTAVSVAIGKAIDGKTASLQRYGIVVKKGETIQEALTEAERKYAGQARASTTESERFHAALTNIETTVGTGILPVFNRYLKLGTDWISQSKNQKRVTDDVKVAVGAVAGAMNDAKTAIKAVDDVTGGFKQTVELLLALKVISTLAAWKASITGLIGTAGAAGAAGGVGLAGAEGAAGGLLVKMKALTLKPWVIAVALSFIPSSAKGQKELDAHGIGWLGHLPIFGGEAQQAGALGGWLKGDSGSTASVNTNPGVSAADLSKYPNAPIFPLSGTRGKIIGVPGAGTHSFTSGPNNWESDNAIDIAVKVGTKVLAIVSGTIGQQIGSLDSSDPKMQGLRLHLIGDDGNEYYYAHLSAIQVKAGQRVKRGAVLGLSGSANGTAHLHFASEAGNPLQLTGQAPTLTAQQGAKTTPVTFGDTTKGPPKAKKVAGTSAATITSLIGSVAAQALKAANAPGPLDAAEKSIIGRMKKLADAVTVKTTPAQLATTRVELGKLSTSLTAEMGNVSSKIKAAAAAQKKALAAAAAVIQQSFDQSWTLMTTKIDRTIAESWAQTQQTYDRETNAKLTVMQRAFATKMTAFDAATQAGLQGFVVAQTPAEKALADFVSGRSADAAAKQKADLKSQIADTQAQLAALGVSTSSGGGALIDIATGSRTALAQTSTDIVAQQKQLTDQLMSLQDQWGQLQLDDQQAALQAAADLSRHAADAQTTAQQQAYQDQRDALAQSLSDTENALEQSYSDRRAAQAQANDDLHNDQVAAFDQQLADWNQSIDKKTATYSAFLAWYASQTLGQPATPPLSGVSVDGTSYTGGARGTIVGGHAIYGFAAGGKVPGRYIGKDDTILARVSPEERVFGRDLNRKFEDWLDSGAGGGGGGGGGPIVTVVTLNGREIARQTAAPMTAAQARQIGYTMQRG